MSHARIEEVSDSDDDVASDPSEGNIDDFVESDILMQKDGHGVSAKSHSLISSSSRQQQPPPPPGASSHVLPPSQMQQAQMTISPSQPDMSKYVDYQHLYPLYFDSTRSRAEGRRVPLSLAVANPLAREIANACGRLRLDTLFEPAKTHPHDWSNPGRVRVGLKDSPLWGDPRGVQNKHHLYVLVAQHLRGNPTSESSPALRVRMAGVPLPKLQDEEGKPLPWPRPNVPRGWKVNGLLPHYSPALTGGGVSENLFKDMMKEMGGAGGPGGATGGLPPGMGGMAEMLQGLGGMGGPSGAGAGVGGSDNEGKKKKDKKKKK